MDLGADEFTTFRKVTLPLIFSGILAAALLIFVVAFVLIVAQILWARRCRGVEESLATEATS